MPDTNLTAGIQELQDALAALHLGERQMRIYQTGTYARGEDRGRTASLTRSSQLIPHRVVMGKFPSAARLNVRNAQRKYSSE